MGLIYWIAMGLVCACAKVETTTTESSPIKTDIIITDPLVLFKTAVFVCGDIIYGDVDGTFPPSDSSVSMIGENTTLAKEYFDGDLDKFCEKIDKYSQCVTHFNKVGCSPAERYIGQYIDMDHFGSALGTYCMNKDLVKNQFLCTLKEVKKGEIPCKFGGMQGLIQSLLLSSTKNVTKDIYCQDRKEAFRCTKKQLAKCDAAYADVMDKVLVDLTAKYCYK